MKTIKNKRFVKLGLTKKEIQKYLDERKQFTLKLKNAVSGKKEKFTCYPMDGFVFIESEDGTEKVKAKVNDIVEYFYLSNAGVRVKISKEKIKKAYKKKKDFYIVLPILECEFDTDMAIYFKKDKCYLQDDDRTKKIKEVEDIFKYLDKFN